MNTYIHNRKKRSIIELEGKENVKIPCLLVIFANKDVRKIK